MAPRPGFTKLRSMAARLLLLLLLLPVLTGAAPSASHRTASAEPPPSPKVFRYSESRRIAAPCGHIAALHYYTSDRDEQEKLRKYLRGQGARHSWVKGMSALVALAQEVGRRVRSGERYPTHPMVLKKVIENYDNLIVSRNAPGGIVEYWFVQRRAVREESRS